MQLAVTVRVKVGVGGRVRVMVTGVSYLRGIQLNGAHSLLFSRPTPPGGAPPAVET